MRDKFRTVIATIPKSKSGDAQTNNYRGEWKYFKSLLFLKDQFTARKSIGNFPKIDDNIFDESSQMSQNGIDDDDDDASEHTVESQTIIYPSEQLQDLGSPLPTGTPSSSRLSTRNQRKRRSSRDDVGLALLEVEKQKLQFLEKKKIKMKMMKI